MTKYQELITRIGPQEASLIKRVAERALGFGWYVTVNDGEENVVVRSNVLDDVFAAVGHTDETYFRLWHDGSHIEGEGWSKVGFVWFVHGNQEDVVADHSDNERIEELMVGIY